MRRCARALSPRSRVGAVAAAGARARRGRRRAAPSDEPRASSRVGIEGNAARRRGRDPRPHPDRRPASAFDQDARRQRHPRHLRHGLLRRASSVERVDRAADGVGRSSSACTSGRSSVSVKIEGTDEGQAARRSRPRSRSAPHTILDPEKVRAGHRGRQEALRARRATSTPTITLRRPSRCGENEVDAHLQRRRGRDRPHPGDRVRGQQAFSDRKLPRRHADQRGERGSSRSSPAPAS